MLTSKLIYDVKEFVRAINEDANLTDALVLHHIDVLRAKYIRQHQRRNVGEDKVGLTQTLIVSLETVDSSYVPVEVSTGINILRSVKPLPRFIGRQLLKNIEVRPVQRTSFTIDFMDKARAIYATPGASAPMVSFIDDDMHLYVLAIETTSLFIERLAVTAILEVPKEVEEFTDFVVELIDYPLPEHLWAQLKPELLELLTNSMQIPEDTVDDNKSVI